MDNLKGKKFLVLDHGHVILMDYMGSDDDIVQAARTCYQQGTIHTSDTRTLLRYLIRHRHTSPLECCTVKMHIKLPIFVERQFCLAGNTEIHFDKGFNSESGILYRSKTTVSDLYKFWNSSNRWKVKRRYARKLDLSTGEVSWTHIKNIWKTGKKEVYEVTVDGGSYDTFKATITSDHPLLVYDSWKTLDEIAELPTESNPSWECFDEVGIIGRVSGGQSERKKPKFNKIDPVSEVWKDIPEWEMYQISSQGRVRRKQSDVHSTFWKLKKPVIRKMGNYTRAVVTLFNRQASKQFVIATLMLRTFFPERVSEGLLVRHLDGNSLNNVLSNLAWGTHTDNINDSIRHGTHFAPVRKFEYGKITNIEYKGVQETYDIEVADEDHNFVAGGLVVHNCRHRTAGWNEVSARYSELPEEYYVPKFKDVKAQSRTNRQGRGDDLEPTLVNGFRLTTEQRGRSAFAAYHESLEQNVARELARINLPLSTYTEKVWWCNLHNILHFLSLRMDSHAQLEIREYANVIGYEIIKPLFPLVWEAFEDYRLNSMQLTALDIQMIQRIGERTNNWCSISTPSKADFLECQLDAWKDLQRCRERDECWGKLLKLGIVEE